MIEVFMNKPIMRPHLSPVLTGLYSLEKQGKIKMKAIDRTNDFQPLCLELLINEKRVCIDVNDGYNNLEWIKKNIHRFDFYFKRSYSEKINKKYGFNMIPYELNYETYSENVKSSTNYNKKKKIKKLLLNLLCIKDSSQTKVEDIHSDDISVNENPKICFYTRLWDKEDILNNNRISIIRQLKHKYGDNFYGGVYNSELSRKLCPDLIVNKFTTIKSKYLKTMTKCDICIATTGLHNSIGWKFAEYVIASKAIVSEKLNYLVPGLKESKNYLEFNDVDDCIQKVDYLVNNRQKILEMMYNNNKYYKKYLKPEVQVMNMINHVMDNKEKMSEIH